MRAAQNSTLNLEPTEVCTDVVCIYLKYQVDHEKYNSGLQSACQHVKADWSKRGGDQEVGETDGLVAFSNEIENHECSIVQSDFSMLKWKDLGAAPVGG